ncbi:MAG: class I SAM-dependent DNA methyltransferase [Selenomonadaceae bacterium]|nr:class I SAM-dependent DNA methyltransferase [Selenomonadaceae bacterium]
MIISNCRDSIKNFADAWINRGSEKSEAHPFWIELIQALGVPQPTKLLQFEVPVDVDGHACFIDGWIGLTKTLIEHKSRGIDLDKPARQSDGMFLTPFDQARRYADARAYSQRPRWIVVCNFVEIRVYDMDRYFDQVKRGEDYTPNVILVERLAQDYTRLNFLIDPDDENVNPAIKISKRAGEIVGSLYKAFEKNIQLPARKGARTATKKVSPAAPSDVAREQSGVEDGRAPSFDPYSALNKLCVRLVFCLYAEDAFIFERNQFTDYVKGATDRRQALVELFDVLAQPLDRRDPNLRAELAAFPYVNGDLFSEQSTIPAISNEVSHYLLFDAGDDNQFNWLGISPTIFGALFESTLNPVTRRSGGMHYTSIENIHKVIDPLFLDDLHDEFQSIKRRRKNKRRELEQFQFKLAALKFFDPACGSGNFLTETYLSLRRLENEVIRELHKLNAHCQIQISIENFYGIEVNDFAVAVARTAMWIAENQMLQETEMIIHEDINFLPLTSAAHIMEGNALAVDWDQFVGDVDYIIGNPPFSGARLMTVENKNDLIRLFDGFKGAGNLDFVSGWFMKAARFMSGSSYPIRAALVATNSIIQGETVCVLWRKLFELIHIDLAHRTFKWISESEDMAAVHCVIIGFSAAPNDKPKMIVEGKKKVVVGNINAYLLDAPNFFIERRATPICDVPIMFRGSQPADGGHLIIEADDLEEFLRREPRAQKFIRRYMMGNEFINGIDRYCLWLVDATDDEINSMPLVKERVEAVRRFRLSSSKAATRKWADKPMLFQELKQPTTNYIALPVVSSERREYIPMGFMEPTIIAGNKLMLVPDAGLYEFGMLMSRVHMAWTRVTCGRLKSDYSYLSKIVYNNFVWASATSAQRRAVEESARGILDARALYPSWTLAALYDPNTMPDELRAAHEHNDRLVEELYGFVGMTELEMVTRLMEMNAALSSEKNS